MKQHALNHYLNEKSTTECDSERLWNLDGSYVEIQFLFGADSWSYSKHFQRQAGNGHNAIITIMSWSKKNHLLCTLLNFTSVVYERLEWVFAGVIWAYYSTCNRSPAHSLCDLIPLNPCYLLAATRPRLWRASSPFSTAGYGRVAPWCFLNCQWIGYFIFLIS